MAWPIGVQDVIENSYITSEDEHALIDNMIQAVCKRWEMQTNMALSSGTYYRRLEIWPSEGYLVLKRWPLTAVTSIVYTDADGNENTFSSSYYWVDTNSEPGRVWLHRNRWWPTTTLRPGPSIVTTYTAGYASVSAVPADIKQALLRMTGDLYENRESMVIQPGVTKINLQYVDELISNYRRYAV